jgi:hypothetical protein
MRVKIRVPGTEIDIDAPLLKEVAYQEKQD